LNRVKLFAGRRPDLLGVRDGRLAPCPTSPNCVSSQMPVDDAEHNVVPLPFPAAAQGDARAAWRMLERAVRALDRVTIVTLRDDYLHAEVASALMGFIDDLECLLDAASGTIQVRSASRVGYSDLGVNRRRVEALRAALARQA
jgi:uncharacterized protein (DUF1499 family)